MGRATKNRTEALLTLLARRLPGVLPLMILVTVLHLPSWMWQAAAEKNERDNSANEQISIFQLEPDRRGGRAYKLVYNVQVPLDVYWRFKTDFDNDFLVDNKYIREHHFISRAGNIVITQNKYATGPDVFFRWQTTVFSDAHRLEFVLTNPEPCRQRFHYGTIDMQATGQGTRVTQVAYFDFWGAALWAAYPWGGGMKDFLSYTARWEQQTVLRLKDRYTAKTAK